MKLAWFPMKNVAFRSSKFFFFQNPFSECSGFPKSAWFCVKKASLLAKDARSTWPKESWLSFFLALPSLYLAIISPPGFPSAMYSALYFYFFVLVCAVSLFGRWPMWSLWREKEIIPLSCDFSGSQIQL